MKNKFITFLGLFLLASTLVGAVVLKGTIRSAAHLTGSYVYSNVVDLGDAQYVTVEVFNDGTAENMTGALQSQWGTTTNNFFPEPVNTSGTASSTETPYTRTAKQFRFSVNSTGPIFTETFKRWGANRYWRCGVEELSGAGTTNSLIRIVATPSMR